MMNKFLLLLVMLLAGITNVLAQDDEALLEKLLKEDPKALEAVSMYPREVRDSILTAMKYPEVIMKIASVRERSSASFKELVSSLPQKEQEKIWNLTRYPGLVDKISEGNEKTSKELKKILESYSEDVRADATQAAEDHFFLLKKISKLNKESSQSFEDVLKPYPPEARTAFRKLLQLPEVIDILYKNMQTTVLVGDMYKRNPAWVQKKTDSLNLELARQNAKETEEWKKSLEEDPEAAKELQQATEEYAEENGYEKESTAKVYAEVVNNYYINPYPYWFGYPWWYPQPCWYPYPLWYDWGFYYGPYGEIIVYSVPSYEFGYWYFYHYHHHYYYPHLSVLIIDHYHHYDHYYGPRNPGMREAVRGWEQENGNIVPKEWDKLAPVKKLDWVKEYSKFSEDYEKGKAGIPGKELGKDEFLQQHRDNYPELVQHAPVKETGKPYDTQPKKTEQYEKPKPEPRPSVQPLPKTKPPVYNKPDVTPKQQPVPKQQPPKQQSPKPQTRPVPKQEPTKKPSLGKPVPQKQMNEALNNHRNNWSR